MEEKTSPIYVAKTKSAEDWAAFYQIIQVENCQELTKSVVARIIDIYDIADKYARRKFEVKETGSRMKSVAITFSTTDKTLYKNQNFHNYSASAPGPLIFPSTPIIQATQRFTLEPPYFCSLEFVSQSLSTIPNCSVHSVAVIARPV
jgi:hypothetical protein